MTESVLRLSVEIRQQTWDCVCFVMENCSDVVRLSDSKDLVLECVLTYVCRTRHHIFASCILMHFTESLTSVLRAQTAKVSAYNVLSRWITVHVYTYKPLWLRNWDQFVTSLPKRRWYKRGTTVTRDYFQLHKLCLLTSITLIQLPWCQFKNSCYPPDKCTRHKSYFSTVPFRRMTL